MTSASIHTIRPATNTGSATMASPSWRPAAMVWPSMPQTQSSSRRTATICTTWSAAIAQSWVSLYRWQSAQEIRVNSPMPWQNHQSPRHTVPACTASSPMRTNAMCSGTAGTASPPDTSALPDWPTIVMPASACGPIRCPSAKTKVRFHQLSIIDRWLI